MQTHLRKGFTIVELLIVIVVIGILATIVIIAYNGVQARAINTSRVAEVRGYGKLFNVYKASTGDFPSMPNGGYCLGSNFPTGIALPSEKVCRDWKASDPTVAHTESASVPLMNELKKNGTIPNNNHYNTSENTIGPFAFYHDNDIEVVGVFKSRVGSFCAQNGLELTWPMSDSANTLGLVTCIVRMQK